MSPLFCFFFFFFNDTATTEIYTLSLHDALPIYHCRTDCSDPWCGDGVVDPGNGEECEPPGTLLCDADCRSEEHTSELQSRLHLVCRLLLEKKKKRITCSLPYTQRRSMRGARGRA